MLNERKNRFSPEKQLFKPEKQHFQPKKQILTSHKKTSVFTLKLVHITPRRFLTNRTAIMLQLTFRTPFHLRRIRLKLLLFLVSLTFWRNEHITTVVANNSSTSVNNSMCVRRFFDDIGPGWNSDRGVHTATVLGR